MNVDDINHHLAKVDIYDPGQELGYQAKRGGLVFVARRTAEGVATLFEGAAETITETLASTVGGTLELVVGAEIARDIGALAGAFGNRILGMMGMGLAAGVSAGFVQMDYVHQKSNIKNFYKEELAARLHKKPSDVTVQDMEQLSKTTPVIDEELTRARRQRNFGVPLAVVGTLAAFAAVSIALPAVMGALSIPMLTGVGGFLLKAAVSMTAYMCTKIPLQRAADKYYGLYNETTNDRIFQLNKAHCKGLAITPEQVMSIFAKANPSVAEAVMENFGKPYDSLTDEQKHKTVEAFRSVIPAQQLANDINAGKVRTTELAFAASGQVSGVAKKAQGQGAEEGCAPTQTKPRFQDKFASRATTTSHVERLENSTLIGEALHHSV